jgi:ABC-type transport system involved in cytochrome bd biosynthesis fused ATPase/permease subunit
MYPFVILGVIALVVFILLQTINRNDMMNAGVSLFIALILTYFVIYLRISDKRRERREERRDERDDKRKNREENVDFLFWFNPNY